MSRVDMLPETALEEAVRDLERDIREIKSIQFMGADVLVPKVNVTANVYDATSSSSGGSQVIRKTIVFTADHQSDPFITLVPKFYNSSDVEVDQSFFSSVHVYKGQVPVGEFGRTKDLSLDMPGTGTATMSVDAASSSAFKMKVYVLATDTGAISLI